MFQELTLDGEGQSSNPLISIEDTEMMSGPPPLGSQTSQGSQDSCHMDVAELQGIMSVQIRPPSVGFQLFGAQTEMDTYKMDAQPRGVALIIDNEKFENEVQEDRHGTAVDRSNLKKLFQQLDFVVEEKVNLNEVEFRETLITFSDDKRHEKADMMVLIVLSHGNEGVINTTDGSAVELESIFEHFNNKSCPMLKGKPKLFIIQACRGIIKDKGTIDDAIRSQTRRTSPRSRRTRGDMDAHPIPSNNVDHVSRFARPTVEDMIMAYSTLPGYSSNRDRVTGTWFIQSLVEVFMNHAAEHELFDLLRMTSQRLSQFENEQREKQTCNIEMRGLYKRLYFMPSYN